MGVWCNVYPYIVGMYGENLSHVRHFLVRNWSSHEIRAVNRHLSNRKHKRSDNRKSHESTHQRNESHAKWREIYRSLFLATSDSQTFLALAYGISFWLAGKCTMSAYHYAIATDIVLLTCSNFNASTFMIRDYWRAPVTTIFRYGAITVIYFFLGLMLNLQRKRLNNPEWRPPLSRNNSIILLPASCFLDPDFRVFNKMSEARLDNIGRPMAWFTMPEFGLYIPTTTIFAIGFLENLFQCLCCRGRENKPEKPNRPSWMRWWRTATKL